MNTAAPAPSPATTRQPAVKVMFVETDRAGIEVEPDAEGQGEETGWCCTLCRATHRTLTAKCRICESKRKAPASTVATSATPSAERAALQDCISKMQMCNVEPAAIAKVQAELARLDKPVVPPTPPDLLTQLGEATSADTAAAAYVDTLIDKEPKL